MNIFYLDICPTKSAQYMGDKHVVKMTLETAQILSTTHRVIDGTHWIDTSGKRKVQRWTHYDKDMDRDLYKATHVNHPSVVWAREGISNYEWVRDHFYALCIEYTHRYGKNHKCEMLSECFELPPYNLRSDNFTAPPMAMPDEYKTHDVVESYRNYYRNAKKDMHKWTRRERPDWLIDGVCAYST